MRWRRHGHTGDFFDEDAAEGGQHVQFGRREAAQLEREA
jgi:hypothetical protein